MPSNAQSARPTIVLPLMLCRAFGHSRQYPLVDNQYRNGESQRLPQAANSRKSWMLTPRITPVQLAALQTFYEARKGMLEPFYFYDPYETAPRFSWDPTGTNPVGRYTVRFNSEWNQTTGLGWTDVQIELIEVA